MNLNKCIKNLLSFFRKYKIIFFLIWFLVVLFFALDGISRNIYVLDIDFIFKGIYNNRFVLYIPIWGYLFLRVVKGNKSKFMNFLSKHSLLIFIIILNIYNALKVLPFENYVSYILRLIVSFFIVVSVIPFLRRILKLFEGKILSKDNSTLDSDTLLSKKDMYICVGIIMVSLLVRFLFLNNLYPTTDEYLHLVEAKNRIIPAADLYNDGDYTRAYFITWIIEKLFTYFGMSVSIARLPGVVISCLTVILSYVLLRKENKTLAVFTALLFALSPWVIMLSRTIREYIYFLPLFVVLGIYLYGEIKKLLEKKYKIINLFVDILIFGLLSYYSFFIDPLSTAKFFLIIYAGGFIYWLVNVAVNKNIFDKIKESKAARNILIAIGVIYVLLVAANKLFGLSLAVSQIDIIPSINLSWIKYIFINDEYGSLILGGIFLLAGLISSIKDIKKNGGKTFSAYSAIAFLAIIYFFTFHFGRYYRPRYISIALPFIIYLQAYGLLYVKEFLFKEVHICRGNILVLFLLLVNWSYFFYSFLSSGTGYVKISQEFHEGYGLVYEELKDRDYGYVLVTTLPDAADWYWDEDILGIYLLSYTDEEIENRLDSFVRTYDRGFFVIDSRRNTWAGNIFKYSDYTTISGYDLKFVGTVDVYMIYEWNWSTYAYYK
jgi:hypothetical protein